MIEVNNLQGLKIYDGDNGDIIFAKGHSSAADGGGGLFMWREEGGLFSTGGVYGEDNNGTIIKSNLSDAGRWVRQYDGYVNVAYFGARGIGGDYNTAIQNAIDFAKINTGDVSRVKSSTVFIPNGSYKLTNIILKSGVTILGESISNTVISQDAGPGYLFEIEGGPVYLNIYNLKIDGRNTNRGCFLFEGKASTERNDGGLWYSNIKNVEITRFRGNGIYLEGGVTPEGGGGSLFPHQFNVFENVNVLKDNDATFSLLSNALKMTGQIGQHTFINCQFDGFRKVELDGTYTYDKWVNVLIENISGDSKTSAVVSFLNCTIQSSDYGVRLNFAENITFDNCWFETLGVAIMVLGDNGRCKGINILNNRFANAAGFGSLPAPNNIKNGQCVSVRKSVVNIYNNYVTATTPDDVDSGSKFVIGFSDNNGINCSNNTFLGDNPKLSITYGITQNISVLTNSIDCKSNKLVYVNSSADKIKNIESGINAGEILIIRANSGSIFFDNTGNIFLTNRSAFSLADGEIASFVKIDRGNLNVTYQLLSFTKTTP